MALVKGVKNLNGSAHQGDVGLVNLPKSIVSHQFNVADINTLWSLFGLDPTFHDIQKIRLFPIYCRRLASKRGGPPSKGLSDRPKL